MSSFIYLPDISLSTTLSGTWCVSLRVSFPVVDSPTPTLPIRDWKLLGKGNGGKSGTLSIEKFSLWIKCKNDGTIISDGRDDLLFYLVLLIKFLIQNFNLVIRWAPLHRSNSSSPIRLCFWDFVLYREVQTSAISQIPHLDSTLSVFHFDSHEHFISNTEPFYPN